MVHHACVSKKKEAHQNIWLCSTRVSNELGAGRPRAARLAVHVVMFLAVSEGLVMGLVLICMRYVWGHAYSDEEEVVRYVARMMLVIAVSNFFDGIQCVLSGTALPSLKSQLGADSDIQNDTTLWTRAN